ncbi:MAG: ribosomal RNA small subunit methyltransferase A [Bacteroidales bacterium]|jgi:16S rRNA (adenine1518-N6/adenine1519-N6)-dimethyltransferase|nr:ribosomal RNA small subunit methyltransferase A [Bacteroidales bacterium]
MSHKKKPSGPRYEGVRAKKALGQHFLSDEDIAIEIVDSLLIPETGLDESPTVEGGVNVLEIGPGTGVLTKFLLMDKRINLQLCEIDTESIDKLRDRFPQFLYTLQPRDFLKTELEDVFPSVSDIKSGTNGNEVYVIGNFPYNISSQIFFKILEDKDRVTQVVCMLQKEVAERLASGPGGRDYGILSVLLQTWYDIEYLFTVDENAFVPPPKVKSGVIRLWRNTRESLECNWDIYKNIIKTTFGMRRKTLRNSIRQILSPDIIAQYEEGAPLLDKRPEQLGVEDFINLALIAGENTNK